MKKIRITLGFILQHPLSKRHVLRAITRLLVWQIQSAIFKKLVVKTFISSVRFYAKKGLTGVTGNIYAGLHEFEDMGFLLHFLRPDDVFFDVGANVGTYTLLASGICEAKSFSLEPVATTFKFLEDNILLNNLAPKVTAINSGAGANEGFLNFSTDEDTTNHVVLADEQFRTDLIKIPVITLDSLLVSALPILIKIDVEGFETEVLKGMREILANTTLKAIIIELNGSGERYGYDENDIHNLILSENFNPCYYDPFTRTLIHTQGYGTHNTIYCRDFVFVTDRLKKASAFEIFGEVI